MKSLSNREMIAKARTVLRPRTLWNDNTAGESGIARIAAVWGQDVVLPPCGRCREFMHQIDASNSPARTSSWAWTGSPG